MPNVTKKVKDFPRNQCAPASILPFGTQFREVLGFKFRAIPSEVMASRTLTSTAKLVFTAMMDASRGTKSGLCKAANATIADRIGRSDSDVSRCILALEAAGLIRRVFGSSKHVRVGIEILWAEEVPGSPGTEQVPVPRLEGTGSQEMGNLVPGLPGPGRPDLLEPTKKNAAPSSPSLARPGAEPSPTSPEIKTEDQKPTPSEIAAMMRAMVAGEFEPVVLADNPSLSRKAAQDPTDPQDSPALPQTPNAPESHRTDVQVNRENLSTQSPSVRPGAFQGVSGADARNSRVGRAIQVNPRKAYREFGNGAKAKVDEITPPKETAASQLERLRLSRLANPLPPLPCPR